MPPSNWSTPNKIACFIAFFVCVQTSAVYHEKPVFKDYQKMGLQLHNKYRLIHNTGPLFLDDTLNEKADKCAYYYMNIGYIDHSCKFKHTTKYPPVENAGENLYWRIDTNVDAVSAISEAINFWYNESRDYDFLNHQPKPGKEFGDVGHFTQLVWRDTKALGIGFAKLEGNGVCVTSLYGPHGNVVGKTDKNVLPPRSETEVAKKGNRKWVRGGGGGGGSNSEQEGLWESTEASVAARHSGNKNLVYFSFPVYLFIIFEITEVLSINT